MEFFGGVLVRGFIICGSCIFFGGVFSEESQVTSQTKVNISLFCVACGLGLLIQEPHAILWPILA